MCVYMLVCECFSLGVHVWTSVDTEKPWMSLGITFTSFKTGSLIGLELNS